MRLPRSRSVAAFLIAAVAAALAGCASLPPPPERTPSSAFTDTRGTALGKLAEASLVGAGPGESGFRLLPTGDFALDARLTLARRAERSLDVQYYQIQRDSVGLRFLRELGDAARRGVRVRLLVDDLYTSGEDELLRAFSALPNVQVRLFNPLPARGGSLATRLILSLHEFSRINHRMHNKLFVADNRFAVSGGRNMADEYFMRSAAANFIDMDVIAAGPVVRELSQVFDRYWNSDYAWPIESIVAATFQPETAQRRFDELARNAAPEFEPATSDPLGRASVDFELGVGRLSLSFASAEVFADAPAKIASRGRGPDVATVARSTLEAFDGSKNEVMIASPYFIPGPLGMAMLRQAREHKIRVVIITNALGATDEPLVHWRYARYRRELLRLGVEIFELSPSLARVSGGFGDFGKSFGRLHAKVAVIDRQQLFVGSLNLDQRSAWSNTESGLLIASPKLALDIVELVANDRNQSVYRLRLAADGETIEWVATGADGSEQVVSDEPDNSWWLRLKMMLIGPFTSEDLL
jgi:putative cardiolipin synthase